MLGNFARAEICFESVANATMTAYNAEKYITQAIEMFKINNFSQEG